ncbi:MAG: two component regulator propeller domain protein, partial [Ignavibacteria bacterium]|nr:two component regulator propeller domain protein [Ignavibacteria bacterium]
KLTIIYWKLYLTTDYGKSWVGNIYSLNCGTISSIIKTDEYIYLGTDFGFIHSSDNGNNWTSSKNQGLINRAIKILVKNNNDFIAGTYSGIFLSTDNGDNWLSKNIGLGSVRINTIVINVKKMFVGTASGVHLSTDYGQSWTEKNTGLTDLTVLSLAIKDNYIFAGTDSSGVFLSTNNGDSWIQIKDGLTNLTVNYLSMNNKTIIAATEAGLFSSSLSNFGINYIPEQKSLINDISISPNPVTDFIYIDLGDNLKEWQLGNIQIYNVLGELVMTSNLDENKSLRLDVSILSSGIYFIKIGKVTKMFLKE